MKTRGCQVRDIEIRMENDGMFAVLLAGVSISRLEGETQTVTEGQDLEVSIVGRMLSSCFDVDDEGGVRADPNASDPLCSGFAGN